MNKLFGLMVAMALLAPAQTTLAALPTSVTVLGVQAFENVVETGDILVVGRFDLPDDSSPTSWNPDDNPDSPGADGALTQVRIGGPTGTVVASRLTPRIGFGMTGAYFPAGHGLTFGAADTNLCVEGDPAIFATPPTSCLPFFWNPTADVAATPALLKTVLVQMMVNLELDDGDVARGDYVSLDVITETGQPLVEDAWPGVTQIVPAGFFVGVDTVSPGAAPATVGPYAATVTATGENSNVYRNVNTVAGQFLGMNAKVVGTIVAMAVGMALFGVSMIVFRGAQPLAFSTIVPATVVIGWQLGFISDAVVIVTAILFILAGGLWLFKTSVPTN